jgi:hypothetical protein
MGIDGIFGIPGIRADTTLSRGSKRHWIALQWQVTRFLTRMLRDRSYQVSDKLQAGEVTSIRR